MLKKVFIGLLVLSVLSTGFLFFMLKKSGSKDMSVTVNSHESADSEHSQEPSEGHENADGEAGADKKEELAGEDKMGEKVAKESEEGGHEKLENAEANKEHETSSQENKKLNEDKVVHESEKETQEVEEEQSLRLLTEPAGASVFADGEYVGSTPVDVKLKSQPLKLSIEAPGYKRFERTIPAKGSEKEKGKSLFAAVMKIHLEAEKKSKKSVKQTVAETTPVEQSSAQAFEEKEAQDKTTESAEKMNKTPEPFEPKSPVAKVGKKAHNPLRAVRNISKKESNFYIQVKSLPDQGSNTQQELSRLTALIREKSSFAVHSCRVEIKGKGNWVRLLVGPFDSVKEAETNLKPAAALGVDTESPFVTGDQKCL